MFLTLVAFRKISAAKMPNLFFFRTFVTDFSISMCMSMCWVGLESDKEVDLLRTTIFFISAAVVLFLRAGHGAMDEMSFFVLPSGPVMLLISFPCFFFLGLLLCSGVCLTVFRFQSLS